MYERGMLSELQTDSAVHATLVSIALSVEWVSIESELSAPTAARLQMNPYRRQSRARCQCCRDLHSVSFLFMAFSGV